MIVCFVRGSVHHLPYSHQSGLFAQMATLIKERGFGICADPCIGSYFDEQSRQLVAAELGYAYLKAVIENGAPLSIITVAIDILHNDVLADGEYKNSLDNFVRMARNTFNQVMFMKIWPDFRTAYGDYLLILRNEWRSVDFNVSRGIITLRLFFCGCIDSFWIRG